MWVRGLKRSVRSTEYIRYVVAPYVGAWIETTIILYILSIIIEVAPYVGAWIETWGKGGARATTMGHRTKRI